MGVWIDYNHDGDFTDAMEQVVGYNSTQGLVWMLHALLFPNRFQPVTPICVFHEKGSPLKHPVKL
jgi:hypothetical protein